MQIIAGIISILRYLVSVYVHILVLVWWRPEFRAETSSHVIKLFAKCVLLVTENINRYHTTRHNK